MSGGIGGLIMGGGNIISEAGGIYENTRRANMHNRLAMIELAQQERLQRERLGWAEEDWERFKTDFGPLEEIMLKRADEGIKPQLERVAGRTNADVQSAKSGAVDGTEQALMQRGINPGSGQFAAAVGRNYDTGAKMRGTAIEKAKTAETNRASDVTHAQRLQTVSLGLGIPTEAGANITAGASLVGRGGDQNLQIARNYGMGAAQAAGGLGRAIGQTAQGYRQWRASRTPGVTYSSPDYDGSGMPDYGWSSKDYADDFNSQNAEFDLPPQFKEGGIIRGPGTGRSDSIPAVIDGKVPARVSNGEYKIPNEVVERVGADYLQGLVDKARNAMNAKEIR